MSSNCLGRMYCFCTGSLEIVPHVYDNGQRYRTRYGLKQQGELVRGSYNRSFSVLRYKQPEVEKLDFTEKVRPVYYLTKERQNYIIGKNKNSDEAEDKLRNGIKERVGESKENERESKRFEQKIRNGNGDVLQTMSGKIGNEVVGELELNTREILRLMIEGAKRKDVWID